MAVELEAGEGARVQVAAPALVDDVLVGGKPEGVERGENVVRGALHFAFAIDILHAHDPAPARAARVQPAAESGNERAEMQAPGRGGSEAAACHREPAASAVVKASPAIRNG